MKALEAVLANRNKLSMKSLEAVERAAFGHCQKFVDIGRIAMARDPYIQMMEGLGLE